MIRTAAIVVGLMGSPAAADFVLNNLRFTLYHEVGHAVIDQKAMPVTGSAETAADGFAIFLANRLHDEAELREVLTDVIRLSRDSAAHEVFDPWAEYMPGSQRIARTICLWFGLAPERREELARAFGMPPSRDWFCRQMARDLRSAWAPVLDSLQPVPGAAPTLLPNADGKALRLLARDILRLNGQLALPKRTPIAVENCGEDNAFYYHYDDRMVICAELVVSLRLSGRK